MNEFVPLGSERVCIAALPYPTLSPVEWGLTCIKINACCEHLQILLPLIHLYVFHIATRTLFLILIICACACCAGG